MRRLWARSEEEQKRPDSSGLLYEDPELARHLDDVVTRLMPADVSRRDLPVRVRVLRNPLLNAFAFPNGAIYVHTGILARLDNEAQLATLLAHELTHATHRHTLLMDKNADSVLLTRDGLELQAIRIDRLAADAELPHTKRKAAAGMPVHDLAELELDNVRANPEALNFALVENVPATVAGRSGFRLVYGWKTRKGLAMRAVIMASTTADISTAS